MGREKKLIAIALRMAQKSSHKKAKMGAIITKGSRILGGAPNGRVVGRHAELRAISKDADFTGCTITVVRTTKSNSRPCRTCFQVIKKAGIVEILFINEEGEITIKSVLDEDEKDYKDMEFI